MNSFIDHTMEMAGIQDRIYEFIRISTKVFLLKHPRIARKLDRIKDKNKAFEWGIKNSPTFKKFARQLNAI